MDTNMGESSDIQTYVKAVRESGANVIEIKYIPFSETVPEINVSGPIVLYGSVNFISQAQKSMDLVDGVFGDSETFTYESWASNYGEMLLNSPDGVELTTIGGFSLKDKNTEEFIFVRPQHDTKSLVGKVWVAKDFLNWTEEAKKGSYAGVDKDTPIVIAKPYGIDAEWRLFIVDNEIVGSSQYHKNGKLYKKEGIPNDVAIFAKKAIEKWSPVPAYVLDICHSAGNCYIVEAQGFNSAGHYAANLNEVVKAVNKVVTKLWLEKNYSNNKQNPINYR